ncbi:MAG: enoyl-CoA hydratase-related protein [Novosphingobium sp.]
MDVSSGEGSMNAVSQIRKEGCIAVLKIDEPPVNVLSAAVRQAMIDGFAVLGADPAVAAIVLVCGGRTFIAGFDITEFENGFVAPPLQQMIDTIEGVSKPIVAAIHGAALGGGLETALLCSHRIAVPSASVGLPEVHIGLIPGAGGTQRLPRIVGPAMAIDLLISGRSVAAAEALELGLIDALAAEGNLEQDAVAFALRIVAAGGQVPRIDDRQDLIEPFRGKPEFFNEYRRRVAKDFRGFKAPEAIVKAVEAAVELPISEGLEREQELVYELLETREATAQRYAFFAERSAAKIPGMSPGAAQHRIRIVSIFGAGGQADSLCARFSEQGLTVSQVRPGQDFLPKCDLLVVAGMDVAAQHPANALINAASAETIVALADNFSALDELAATMARPEGVIGLHFNPGEGKLVEVVRGERSEASAVLPVMDLLKRMGKVPVLCRPSRELLAGRMRSVVRHEADVLQSKGCSVGHIRRALFEYGFPLGWLDGVKEPGDETGGPVDFKALLGSLLYPVVNEAAQMLEQGHVLRASDIDMAAIHALAWPVYTGGPMFWADTIGLPTIVRGLDGFATVAGDSYRPRNLLRQLASEGKGICS